MKILILGDIMGSSGRIALKKKLPTIIKENKINFVVVNGENAADDGKGITRLIAEEFFEKGVDVITSGNHIWDKDETTNFIEKESRLLRPANFVEGSPGKGYEIFLSKDKKYKIGVVNLMGNVHGEITSEKMAIGHFFDGLSTCVVGTHTHIPTADTRILEKGTAYQTDIGMCGDYNSVIGMNKENSIKRFLKDKNATKHFPAEGDATLSGIIVDTNIETGLAKNVTRLLVGGILEK